jgi:phosphoribosylglycinamide formyltransferase 1
VAEKHGQDARATVECVAQFERLIGPVSSEPALAQLLRLSYNGGTDEKPRTGTDRMSRTRPFRIAVLISGGGTTLRNFIEKIAAGTLPVEIALVISSSPTAKGLRFAADAGIDRVVIDRREFESQDDFSRAIFDHCRERNVDLVVMAGFLKRVTIPNDFAARVVNIHPGLIPAFCGQGFYGHKVHEAVLEYGAKLSGCTVHFADNQYDHGPVILQKAVRVLDDDTPETLAARVFEAECEAYPEALRLIAAGRVSLGGRRVRIEREP